MWSGLAGWVAGLVGAVLLAGAPVAVQPDRPGTHLLTGRFVDPSGSPVDGTYSVPSGDPDLDLAAGRFAVALTPEEQLSVVVRGGRQAALALSLGAARLADGDVDLGDLVVPAFDSLDVRVLAPDGASVPEASTMIDVDLTTQRSDLDVGDQAVVRRADFSDYTVTGAHGVAAASAPSGAEVPAVRIRASRPNGHSWQQTVPQGGALEDGALIVRLSGSPRISGTLVDRSGSPLPGWTASVGESRARSGPAGRFALPMTAGGDRLVLARLGRNPSYVKFWSLPTSAYFSVSSDRLPVDADLDLGEVPVHEPEPVTLEVVDARGVPVPGASIRAVNPIDLLDPGVDWAGADDELAPGVGIWAASWWPSFPSTDAEGRMRVRIPRDRGGALLDVPVETSFRTLPNASSTTSAAVRRADGTYRIVLPDLVLPARPDAPLRLRARPADGAVSLSWDDPRHDARAGRLEDRRAGRAPTYLVTDLADGTTTTVDTSPALVPAKNGVAQSWTVRRVSGFGAGAPARSNTVVPGSLTLRTTGTRDGEVILGEFATYTLSSSVPFHDLNCDPGKDVGVVLCKPTRVRLQSVGPPGTHAVDIWAYDLAGSEGRIRRTFVVPTPITDLAPFSAAWRVGCCPAPHVITWRRGASLELPDLRGDRLDLVVETGRGQGVLEARADGRVVGRVDLGRLPKSEKRVVRLVRAGLGPEVQLRVVSTGKPVSVYAYAASAP